MPSMESMRADRDADELVRHISELEGWGVKLEKGRNDYHGLRSIADFHTKRLQQVDYLYAGLGAILFSGPNDVGKSSVVEQLAARVLLGHTTQNMTKRYIRNRKGHLSEPAVKLNKNRQAT